MCFFYSYTFPGAFWRSNANLYIWIFPAHVIRQVAEKIESSHLHMRVLFSGEISSSVICQWQSLLLLFVRQSSWAFTWLRICLCYDLSLSTLKQFSWLKWKWIIYLGLLGMLCPCQQSDWNVLPHRPFWIPDKSLKSFLQRKHAKQRQLSKQKHPVHKRKLNHMMSCFQILMCLSYSWYQAKFHRE